MATLLVSLLLLTVPTAIAQIPRTNITSGSSLSPITNPTRWLSPSGRFAFGFYPINGGFMVGIWIVGGSQNAVVWTANRDSPPVSSGASLLLSNSGRLLLTTAQRQIPLITTAENATYAAMLDSGNFILYNSRSQVIWERFKFPTDTVLATQTMRFMSVLFSHQSDSDHSVGRFRMALHEDGNLVSYPIFTTNSSRDAYWSSGTWDQGSNVPLNLENDGRLYLVNSTGFAVRNRTQSQSGTAIFRATVDVDGVFRLYAHPISSNGSVSDGTALWDSIRNEDRCDVKGLCGLNSFCRMDENGPSCQCPQGFDYVDPDQKFQGCKQRFPYEECGEVQKASDYKIFTLENIVWEEDEYRLLTGVSMEECKQGCLLDCDCKAALFSGRGCTKQKLPLRYGKQNFSAQYTAFMKAASRDLATDPIRTKKKSIDKVVLVVGIVLIGISFITSIVSSCVIFKRSNVPYGRIPANPSADHVGEVNLRSFVSRPNHKVAEHPIWETNQDWLFNN